VGVPTSGPGAAHSGTNCAATILNGNYADAPGWGGSRFISPAFSVPASNQFPRLRFWHWYDFACANCFESSGCDYGVVEVKGTNETWQAVSPTYYGTGGGWTYASVDLSLYAGQTVQVAFHLVYGQSGCENTAAGWYVDDIGLITGTPVFNNPEGFEQGIGDWYAETGTWQVGVPTSGPGAAHSGTNCAATILNGNYADAPGWGGSRFISPAFSVPAANQFPRLRFWHWYTFACANCFESSGCDYGVVEAKGTNGTWEAVSPTYYGTGGGWTYASVDLSAYAGQTVQVAFHVVYGQSGCENTAAGWYVDDIGLNTGTPVFNNPEGFEQGIGDWYAETGTWQVGVPTSGPGAAHSGTNCAATILNGNYADTPGWGGSRLVSPKLILPPAPSSPALRFWHWYSFACANCFESSGCDYGVVEVKAGTNGWAALSPNYTGNGGGVWTYPFFDLTAYGGQTVQFAFHIVYNQSGCENTAPGWYVDDVLFPIGALAPIPNFSIYPNTPWSYTPPVPGSGFSFSLSNAPAGMSIDTNAGTISWTPTSSQLGIYSNITFVVSQAGSPPQPLSSATFSATVNAGSAPLQPPSISITNLANGTNFLVPAIITIDTSTSDPNASGLITQVAFFSGTNEIGLVTNAPFNLVWTNQSLGSFVLTAIATDNYNLSSNSLPVSVTVSRRPLNVVLTQPTNGATFPVPSNIPLTATASDSNSNGVISQISILAATNVLGTSTASPLSITWTNPTFGAYVLEAVAQDNFGIITTSAPVDITVTVQKPVVAITSPSNSAAFAGGFNISINATASDTNPNGSIVRVSFYAGTNLLTIVSNSPYSFVWTNPAVATYTLTAVAVDNYGASATSPQTTVIVNPPTYIFTFNSPTYSVDESGATVALTVVNHASLTGYVSYQTVDGTAHGSYGAGGDYTASQGNLSFTGQTSLPINIPIINNFLDGSNLQFQVVLLNPTIGSIGSPGTATVTIMRNDPGYPTNAVLQQLSPATRPPMTGQLTVWLPVLGPTPAPAFLNGMQWRFPWEFAWRSSGSTAISLVAGDYPVEFRSVPGYLAIPLASDPLVTNGLTTVVTNAYYGTPLLGSGALGSLTVVSIPANQPGAGWQFVGETAWRANGSTAANLLPDTYLVAFEPVAGYATPTSLAVLVSNGMSVTVAGNYVPAQTLPSGVDLPQSQSTAIILNYTNGPYGFSGQLQTDVGYGSGAAVTANVVLTAAHLVFNDYTLSYVTNAWWSFQEQADVFQPEPQAARGWYVLSGYASARTNDLPPIGSGSPGQPSTNSQDNDVAALYFLNDSARTGFGGFISSDAVPNPFLTGSALKTLVGYPVDASMFSNEVVSPGLLYATPLDHQVFFQTNDQVYAATWLFSYPGNSGGPLCVLYTNGLYYPVAVYLGTLFNNGVPYASAVRAIDSNAFNLITMASELGDTGTNNSGGGPIRFIPVGVSSSNPGYLLLQLSPPSAVQAGAAWDLAGQPASYYSTVNPSLQEITTTNPLMVQFKSIAGWNPPASNSVTVSPGVILTYTAMYTVTNPLLAFDPANGLGIFGTTNTTYQIQINSSLSGGTWTPFLTNTLGSPGFNLITNKPSPGFYRALWLGN
jgi:hypothetical protein